MAGILEIEEEIADFEIFSTEASADLTTEGSEELENLLAEAKMGVEDISSTESFIKECISIATPYMKSVLTFISKNAAIGVILYGVNYAISKIFHGGQEKGDKQILAFIRAVLKVLETETNMSKTMAAWLKDHKDDMVELDGIEIPLDALLYKYFQPVFQAMDQAYSVMKSLKEKVNGKVQYKVPSAEDIQTLLNAADDFLKNCSLLIAFISTNVQKFPVFRSFALKQDDIDNLKIQLENAKAAKI